MPIYDVNIFLETTIMDKAQVISSYLKLKY